MQRKLHERADASQNCKKTNYLRSCISARVDLFRNVPTATINMFLPCYNVVKILRFYLCAAAQTPQPLRSVIPVRFTSPSERLEVGQISWHWRPFPLLRQCDTHSRVSLASRFVLEPDPLKRVTLSCNVTCKLEQKGSLLHRPRMEIRALLCKMDQNRT